MITKSDIIKYIKDHSYDLNMIVDEDNNCIYDQLGDFKCTIDDYVEILKLKIGCSFTSLYYNHATLQNVLKCNKCGTVILSTEDENYDPNLRCPTCTNYRPSFKYYTEKEIESNKEVKNLINFYIKMDKFEDEAYKYEKLHGRPYWMLFKKKIYAKNHMYSIELHCDDARKNPFKGLYLDITSFTKDPEEKNCYSNMYHVTIPLSASRIYLHCIYPHLGKCHKDFRSKWYIGKPKEERK